MRQGGFMPGTLGSKLNELAQVSAFGCHALAAIPIVAANVQRKDLIISKQG
jgi:hypothetical protein